MSATLDKVLISCPKCGKNLQVPTEAMGKNGRCPSCSHLFPLQEPLQASYAQPALSAPAPAYSPPALPSPPVVPAYTPSSGSAVPQPNPFAGEYDWPRPSPDPFASTQPLGAPSGYSAPNNTPKYSHGFGLEHRGWDAGMLGGLAMMGIAALWFVLGLACGYIFFYPPILFVIGLIGFFRGLFNGNITGRAG
jgi:hypothetical protein